MVSRLCRAKIVVDGVLTDPQLAYKRENVGVTCGRGKGVYVNS